MKNYKISDDFEMIGAFWKPGEPDTKFTGTLNCERGRVELISSPAYLKPGKSEYLFDEGKHERIPVLWAFTSENNCTLLNSLVLHGSGNTNHDLGHKISSTRYLPMATVLGLHLKSSEAKSISFSFFFYTKLNHLLPAGLDWKWTKSKVSYSVPLRTKQIFKFDNITIGATVSCEIIGNTESRSFAGTMIRTVPRIRIRPKTPKGVDWFRPLAFRVENFFSLFLGSSLSIKHIYLFQGKERGLLIQKTKQRKEKVVFPMVVRCPTKLIAEAFDKWLDVPSSNQPVELTLLGMVRKSDLFPVTEFLSLAQALEGFGRIRYAPQRKKSFKFDVSIGETYDLLTPDFAEKIVGERSTFIKKVLLTRNYYTHLGSARGSGTTIDENELFLLNKRLQAFLRCVMLLDLGIPEQFLWDPITYQATRWKVI